MDHLERLEVGAVSQKTYKRLVSFFTNCSLSNEEKSELVDIVNENYTDKLVETKPYRPIPRNVEDIYDGC